MDNGKDWRNVRHEVQRGRPYGFQHCKWHGHQQQRLRFSSTVKIYSLSDWCITRDGKSEWFHLCTTGNIDKTITGQYRSFTESERSSGWQPWYTRRRRWSLPMLTYHQWWLSCGIHLIAISQEMLKLSILYKILKPYLPWANELIWSHWSLDYCSH